MATRSQPHEKNRILDTCGVGLVLTLALSAAVIGFIMLVSNIAIRERKSQMLLRKKVDVELLLKEVEQFLMNPEQCRAILPTEQDLTKSTGVPIQSIPLPSNLKLGAGSELENGMVLKGISIRDFVRSKNAADYNANLVLEIERNLRSNQAASSFGSDKVFRMIPLKIQLDQPEFNEAKIFSCVSFNANNPLSCASGMMRGIADDLSAECINAPKNLPAVISCKNYQVMVGVEPSGQPICVDPRPNRTPAIACIAPPMKSCDLICPNFTYIQASESFTQRQLDLPIEWTYLDERQMRCHFLAGSERETMACQATCVKRDAE